MSRKIVQGNIDNSKKEGFFQEVSELEKEKALQAKKEEEQQIANMSDSERWRYYLIERQMKKALELAKKEYYGD